MLKDRKKVSDIRADDLIGCASSTRPNKGSTISRSMRAFSEHLPLLQHRITGIVSRGGSMPGLSG
jgi:hypothetical protein